MKKIAQLIQSDEQVQETLIVSIIFAMIVTVSILFI
jgi:hypothetical protein